MTKRIGLVVAGLGAAVLMAGGTAYAASSSSATTDSASSTTIYGCYDSGGNLKVILPLGSTTCPKGYSALDWNQTGPQGPAGQNGQPGTPGAGATVTPLPSGDPNCPNGGAEIQDGNPSDPPAYACNGTNGTNGSNGSNGTNGTNGTNGANGAGAQFTWTYSCQYGQCDGASAATSLPAGTLITPVSITETGPSCTQPGVAVVTDSDGNTLGTVNWQFTLYNPPSGSVGSADTLTKAGPLQLSQAHNGCDSPFSIVFTFDETENSTYN